MGGFVLPQFNTGAGAPPVEDGLATLRFDGLRLVEHDDWATEKDAYGKPDDGQRYHFDFTLLDEDRDVVYNEATGEPIELDAITRTATGEKSNFFAILSGILTPQELALYQAATPEEPFDGSELPGRVVNGKIGHSRKGWPQVESVIGVAKARKAK